MAVSLLDYHWYSFPTLHFLGNNPPSLWAQMPLSNQADAPVANQWISQAALHTSHLGSKASGNSLFLITCSHFPGPSSSSLPFSKPFFLRPMNRFYQTSIQLVNNFLTVPRVTSASLFPTHHPDPEVHLPSLFHLDRTWTMSRNWRPGIQRRKTFGKQE